MDGHGLALSGIDLVARPSGALWWPDARLLCVADLHMGKSGRIVRRGGTLLPPYETIETLDRLASEIRALNPRSVICLGDSFDDNSGAAALSGEETGSLLGHIGEVWV